MKKKFIIIVLLFCAFIPAYSQNQLTPDSVMAKVAKGKPYTLVFLKSGKKIPTKTLAAQQMQIAHLTNLFTLEQQGKISIFGPIVNDIKLRGIIVFNSTDREYIKNELSNDPYIKAGYLKYELLDWFSIPGQKLSK
jgi:uncharacterized protein YciI